MKDKKIDEYIEKQKSPQKEILKKLRKLILKTILDCDERMAWGVPVFKKGKFYIVGLKDKVNLGFAIKGLTKKEVESFEGNGKTMRHIKIYSLEDYDEKKIVKLVKLVDKKAKCVSCVK